MRIEVKKDYQELAKFTLMVLSLTYRFNFQTPGTVHHTRFITKGFYFLKMYLLMDEIPNLREENERKIKGMACFTSISLPNGS